MEVGVGSMCGSLCYKQSGGEGLSQGYEESDPGTCLEEKHCSEMEKQKHKP